MILDELAEAARRRVENDKGSIGAEEMKTLALAKKITPFAFETALKKGGLSFICEVKKASPSKGIIAENFDYLHIAEEYEMAGADCISVLTEPTRFLGRDEYLSQISGQVNIPLLRKDFTVDEYMIYQARALGASAVLLICSITENAELKKNIKICDSLGLSALVEAHDENQVRSAVNAGARIIGVNNRNLRDFSVNIGNCTALRNAIPQDVVCVAESGIKTAEDVSEIAAAGFDAVLIGETLMKAPDRKKALDGLRQHCTKRG